VALQPAARQTRIFCPAPDGLASVMPRARSPSQYSVWTPSLEPGTELKEIRAAARAFPDA
jgi:hypothetical protein